MIGCPDCNTPVENSRGLGVHFYRGCPAAIFDLHIDGESVSSLARRFKKTPERINVMLRVEGIRRRMIADGK